MTYLTGEMTKSALERMRRFYWSLEDLYKSNGITLLDDSCRRNNLMSAVQERFFADEMGKELEGVRNDGRTGEPDIIIDSLGKELECKLTSPRADKSIVLQTDYTTLEKKGTLDYLYVIAKPDFDSFCVLLFEGLTISDFHAPYSGSRGKAQMNKALAMEKCHVLWGGATDVSNETMDRMTNRLESLSDRAVKTRAGLHERIEAWKNRSTMWRYELQVL